MTSAVVVLVTGLQGSGKSSVAEGVARRLSVPIVAWDWSMAALTPFDALQDALRQLDAPTYRAVGWALMLQTARQQLRLGSPVVLDALAREDNIAAVRDLGRQCGVPALVALLRCDEELQRARIEARSRGIPGWHELTWEDVARTRSGWTDPVDTDLVLDSARPIDALVEDVVRAVQLIDGSTG